LERLCTWALFWEFQAGLVYYDEYGLAQWLDLLAGCSLVTADGVFKGMGDVKQCGPIVDSKTMITVSKDDEGKPMPLQRWDEDPVVWNRFVLVQSCILHKLDIIYRKTLNNNTEGKAKLRKACFDKPLSGCRRCHPWLVRLIRNISYDGAEQVFKFVTKPRTDFESTVLEKLVSRAMMLTYIKEEENVAAKNLVEGPKPKKKAQPQKNPFTTSSKCEAELKAMEAVRVALQRLIPQERDILSVSSYALQADRLHGRHATLMKVQGGQASVTMFGITSYASKGASFSPEDSNVFLSRTIDLFLLFADRKRYCQSWQPRRFNTGGSSDCFARLAGMWMSHEEFINHINNIADFIDASDEESAKAVVDEMNEKIKACSDNRVGV